MAVVNDLDKSHTLVGYIDKEIHIIQISDVITFQVINKNVTAITSNVFLVHKVVILV
jgi:DNA-binding LytR/AlgR family response regulator